MHHEPGRFDDLSYHDSKNYRLPQNAARQNLTGVVRAAIQNHRDFWVTEADFRMLAQTGFNAVRLPVGYWVVADTQVR